MNYHSIAYFFLHALEERIEIEGPIDSSKQEGIKSLLSTLRRIESFYHDGSTKPEAIIQSMDTGLERLGITPQSLSNNDHLSIDDAFQRFLQEESDAAVPKVTKDLFQGFARIMFCYETDTIADIQMKEVFVLMLKELDIPDMDYSGELAVNPTQAVNQFLEIMKNPKYKNSLTETVSMSFMRFEDSYRKGEVSEKEMGYFIRKVTKILKEEMRESGNRIDSHLEGSGDVMKPDL